MFTYLLICTFSQLSYILNSIVSLFIFETININKKFIFIFMISIVLFIVFNEDNKYSNMICLDLLISSLSILLHGINYIKYNNENRNDLIKAVNELEMRLHNISIELKYINKDIIDAKKINNNKLEQDSDYESDVESDKNIYVKTSLDDISKKEIYKKFSDVLSEIKEEHELKTYNVITIKKKLHEILEI